MTRALCFLFLFAFGLSAQNGDGCMDNCGSFNGNCLSCHTQEGSPRFWSPTEGMVCWSCGVIVSKVEPKVPLSGTVDSVVAFVEKMTPKVDVKLARLMAMTPEKHVSLMASALKSRRDGVMLGSCSKAFKVGTLLQLPDAIAQTRQRLIVARVTALGR